MKLASQHPFWTTSLLALVFLLGRVALTAPGGPKEDDATVKVRRSVCHVMDCPPCVVQIRVDYGDNTGCSGSGVLIDGSHVLTAAHVVSPKINSWNSFQTWDNGAFDLRGFGFLEPKKIEVVFPGRSSGLEHAADVTVNATFIFKSDSFKHIVAQGKSFLLPDDGRGRWNDLPPGGDLALLTLSSVPEWAIPARVAKKPPTTGDWLTSVGLESPDAIRVHVAKMAGQGTGKAGIDPQASDQNSPYIFFEVQAQHGDSGGPVFNSDGELVAINSSLGSRIQISVNTSVWGNTTFVQTWTQEHPCTYLGGHAAIKHLLTESRKRGG